jgi:hypothetical protein
LKKAHYFLKLFNGDILSKVRGQKELDNPPLHFLAKRILNEEKDLPLGKDFQFITPSSRISTIKDYLNSLKLAVKEENLEKIIYPGFSLIESHTFQWNNLDLPYKDFREWKARQSKIGTKNYAELLKVLSFEEVFYIRNNEYFDHINSLRKPRNH